MEFSIKEKEDEINTLQENLTRKVDKEKQNILIVEEKYTKEVEILQPEINHINKELDNMNEEVGGDSMGRGRGRGRRHGMGGPDFGPGGPQMHGPGGEGLGNELQITIPTNKCELVIGKERETIRSINQQSGAHVAIARNGPPDPSQKYFTVRGNPQQIEHAKSLICERIDMPLGQGGPPDHSHQQPQNHYPPQFIPPFQQLGPGQPYKACPLHQRWQGFQVIPNHPGKSLADAWEAYYAKYYGQPTQPQPGQMQAQQPRQQPAATPGGQVDYSAAWSEYYRSLGMVREAEMIEQQAQANQNPIENLNKEKDENSFENLNKEKDEKSFENLNKEKDEKSLQLNDLENQLVSLKKQENLLGTEENFQSVIIKQETLMKLQSTIKSLNDQIENLNNEKYEKSLKLENSESQLISLTEKYQQVCINEKKLSEEVNKLNSCGPEHERKIQKLEEDMRILRRRLKDEIKQKDLYRKNLLGTEENFTSLVIKQDKQDTLIKELQSALKVLSDQIENLKKEKGQKSLQLNDLENQVVSLRKQYQQVCINEKKLSEEENKLNLCGQDNEEKIQNLEEDEINQKDLYKKNLLGTEENFQSVIIKQETLIKELQSTIKSLNDQKTENLKKEKGEKSLNLEGLESQLISLIEKYQQVCINEKKLSEEVNKLNSCGQENEKKIQNLEEDIRILRRRLTDEIRQKDLYRKNLLGTQENFTSLVIKQEKQDALMKELQSTLKVLNDQLNLYDVQRNQQKIAEMNKCFPGLKNESNPNGIISHKCIKCDRCKRTDICGIRYKCKTCNDFDLCEVCKDLPNAHYENKQHVFLKILDSDVTLNQE